MTYKWKKASDLFFEYVVSSSIWMSASLASLTLLTQSVLYHEIFHKVGSNVQLDWFPFFLVFFEALAIYTSDHLRDAKHHHRGKQEQHESQKKRFYYRLRLMKFLRAFGILGLVGCLSRRKSIVGVGLVTSHLLLGLLYAVPLWSYHPRWCKYHPVERSSNLSQNDLAREFLARPTRYRFRLKDIPYFKSFFVAGSVTFMVVAAPLVFCQHHHQAHENWSQRHFWNLLTLRPLLSSQLCTLIFCLVLVVENLQDVRDVMEDWKAGTKTLPVGMGVRRTKFFIMFVASSACVSQLVPVAFTAYEGPNIAVMTLPTLSPIIVFIGISTPVKVFSYLEAVYVIPILFHWLASIFGTSPTLTPPGPLNPAPWHMFAFLSNLGRSFWWYVHADVDKQDVSRESSHKREGSNVIKVVAALGFILIGFISAHTCYHLWSFSDLVYVEISAILGLVYLGWNNYKLARKVTCDEPNRSIQQM